MAGLTRSVLPDVDECLGAPGPCSRGDCTNTVGSYVCSCPRGFVSSLDGTRCLGEASQMGLGETGPSSSLCMLGLAPPALPPLC